MKHAAQFGKRARRGHDHERLHLALAHHPFQRCSDLIRETVLFKIMPVGRFHNSTGPSQRWKTTVPVYLSLARASED